MGSQLEAEITIAVYKALYILEHTKCGREAELTEKKRTPKMIEVKCNLIRGHVSNHSDGANEWSE